MQIQCSPVLAEGPHHQEQHQDQHQDHVKISHLTKFSVFWLNNNQVMDLETWFQIHSNVSNFEMASPCHKILLVYVLHVDI